MPHRLKTPRWYTKRKIQIENTDIWNVAFPEGAEIDPNTAWKVFWKTAACMYGDGCFRVDNISNGRSFLRSDEFIGYWWSKLEYGGAEVSGLTGEYVTNEYHDSYWFDLFLRCTSISHPVQYLNRGNDNGTFSNSERFSLMPLLREASPGCRPGIGLGVDQFSICGGSEHTRIIKEGRLQVSRQLASFSGVKSIQGAQNFSDLFRPKSYPYFNYFNPEDLGCWGLDYLDVDWNTWWSRIETDDFYAYNLANLLWCDWAITKSRTLLDLDHSPVLCFFFARTSTVGPRPYHDSDQSYLQAILHQFNNPLPVRPLDYEF